MTGSKPFNSEQPTLNIIAHILIYLGLVAVGLALIGLVGRGLNLYIAYQKITTEAVTLQQLATTDLSKLSERDLVELKASLNQIAIEFEFLHQQTDALQPVTERLGWLPVYGADIKAAPQLIEAGYNLSQAAVILIDVVDEPLLNIKEENWLPKLVVELDNSHQEIETAAALLRQSQVQIESVQIDTLSPSLAQRVELLQQFLPQASLALELATELPLLLGNESPQTYLILTPNADELRPTGGYITTAGHITFEQGQIVDFWLQDSYAIDKINDDYPYPPDPIYDYMAAGYWLIRDVSWSPDFPTVAETAIDLYERGQGIQVDGVISLDQYGLTHLLRAFKPQKVEGETVTSDNVIQLMRQHWAPNHGQNLDSEWWLQRKSFMLNLAETLRQTIEQKPATINWPIFVQSLNQVAMEKHLLVHLANLPSDNQVIEQEWSGLIPPTDGDYLMMVDANLGFNKVNALIQRKLRHEVKLANDGSAQAQARLGYRHQAQPRSTPCLITVRYDPVYEQNMERCYWNYVRLVTPATARLLDGPQVVVDGQYTLRGEATRGEIDIEPIKDKQSWGQLVMIAPQETLSLDYSYTLPPRTARQADDQLWVYQLYLQKQPGTLDTETEIVITLPDQARLQHSQPAPTSQVDQTITFATDLKIDQKITLYYQIP